ncbi:MAG: CotH kinase family protein [Clostridia bacterium]|nr:CotH kinase family protein [Clostridia bacterium]
MKKCMRAALCLLTAVWMLAGGQAMAQELTVRRVDGIGEAVGIWEKSDGQLYLFLPAYMEGQMLEVRYEGTGSVCMGEMDIPSGSQTDAIQGGAELTLEDGETIIVMQSRNLPAVHLTTASGSLDYIHEKKGNKESGSMTIVTAEGVVNYCQEIDTIKGHGNATFVYEKKSYQVKLEKKAPLLGMDEGKTYVLLANQHENSLLRNRLTFELAAAIGLRYTPECRSVDLYVNGEYRGNYLLCDKVKISSGCVDITDSEELIEAANAEFIEEGGEPELYGSSKYAAGTYKGAAWPVEPEDITGGYLFELEYTQRYPDETSGVVTERGQAVVVKYPEEMSAAQGEYVNELLNRFERAIFAGDGVDAQSGMHYTEIADFDSLVRKYMIEEISKNYDANKSSQYFYKDSDSVDTRIYAGPVWDYDSAWGNYAQEGKLETAAPTGLNVAQKGFKYSWWPALYKQSDFAAQVRSVFDEELKPLLYGVIGEYALPAGSGLKSLDAYAQELSASAEMNFVRWRVLNHSSRAVKTGATYAENIEYLRDWIENRLEYLDKTW